MAEGSGAAAPRIAFLSYSTGEFDARTFRMARSAVEAGFSVTVYARWHPGLAPVEDRDGYRLVRASWDWRFAIPGLRWLARRKVKAAMARTTLAGPGGSRLAIMTEMPATTEVAGEVATQRPRTRRLRPFERWHWWPRIREFPLRPMGWAVALDAVVEPADIWHGMWAGSLPALARMRRRFGGRTIYDSRDVFMRSREFTRLGQPGRGILERLERRWAQGADRVLTVNEAYADLLATQLGIDPPAVVMNCPERWTPPTPRPDRIREALGLSAGTAIVLYQGRLTFERGVEQAMEAILQVPHAVLVLMGFGVLRDGLTAAASRPPYLGRLYLVPPVTPDELLVWTASADVLIMAIQPTTLNHRHTTPQKLFESFAAGVPVVASDLPGMAGIVRETGAGVLCDPTSPGAIAAAIEAIVGAPPAEREAMRSRALIASHERFNWETQVETLFAVYRDLLSPDRGPTGVRSRLPRR